MSASQAQGSPSPRHIKGDFGVVANSPSPYSIGSKGVGPGGRGASRQGGSSPRLNDEERRGGSLEARCSCGALHHVPIISLEAQAATATVQQLRDDLRDAQHEAQHLNEYALQLEWDVRQKENDCVAANHARIMADRERESIASSFNDVQTKLDIANRERDELRGQLRTATRASVELRLQLQEQIQQLQESESLLKRRFRDSEEKAHLLSKRVSESEERAKAAELAINRTRTPSPPSRRSTTPTSHKLHPEPLRRSSPPGSRPSSRDTKRNQSPPLRSVPLTTPSIANTAKKDSQANSTGVDWEAFAKQLAHENLLLEKLVAEKDIVIAAHRVNHSTRDVQFQHSSHDDSANSNAATLETAPFTPLQCAGPLHGPGRYSPGRKRVARTSGGCGALPHAPDCLNGIEHVRQQPGDPLEADRMRGPHSSKSRESARDDAASQRSSMSPARSSPSRYLASTSEHAGLQREAQEAKETSRVLYEVVRQLRNLLAGQLPLIDLQVHGHPIACEVWHAANNVLSRISASLDEPMSDHFNNVADAHRWFPRSVPGIEGSADSCGPMGGPGRSSEHHTHISLAHDDRHHPSNQPFHQSGAQPSHSLSALEEEIRTLQADRRRFERENRELTLQLYSGGLVVHKFNHCDANIPASRSNSRQTRH